MKRKKDCFLTTGLVVLYFSFLCPHLEVQGPFNTYWKLPDKTLLSYLLLAFILHSYKLLKKGNWNHFTFFESRVCSRCQYLAPRSEQFAGCLYSCCVPGLLSKQQGRCWALSGPTVVPILVLRKDSISFPFLICSAGMSNWSHTYYVGPLPLGHTWFSFSKSFLGKHIVSL